MLDNNSSVESISADLWPRIRKYGIKKKIIEDNTAIVYYTYDGSIFISAILELVISNK